MARGPNREFGILQKSLILDFGWVVAWHMPIAERLEGSDKSVNEGFVTEEFDGVFANKRNA